MSSAVTHITTAEPSRTDALIVVANTRHGPGGHHHARALTDGPDHDHLRDPADARAYLVDHGIPVPAGVPPPAAIQRMAVLRGLVRREAADRAPGTERAPRPSDAEIAAAVDGVAFRLGLDGPRPVRSGWTGFVDGLLPALLELHDVEARLRVCGNPRCRFAFIDRSRNRSRVWCESAACGNRIRVGRHRRRALHRPA
jgi:predicted RNA-binding Zn ribbon-like protein